MRATILHPKRAILPVLFILLLCATGMTKALAQEFAVGNLNYSVNDDELSVAVTGHVDGANALGELVIPENVSYGGNTYVVTAIGDNAFYGHYGLEGSLVIPNSVTEIGYAAFSGCSGFNGTLTLGNSLTIIGSYAFEGCSGFTGNLVIPNSVSILGGQYASWGWDWRESYAFLGCSGFNGTLTLSNSLSAIGCGCFMGCSGFTGDLVIPTSVGQLGCSWGDCIDGVFEGCSGFTGDLTILGETEIGTNTFSGCSGFSGMLTLGAYIIGIYDNAFYGCVGFSSITALGSGGWLDGDAESIFAGINMEIPVYVGCDQLDDFQFNPVWSSFSNIQETTPCLWEVLAIADPPEGGTVSGSGLYVYEEAENGNYTINVDLCATPKESYVFYYWTDDFEWNEWDSLSLCNEGSITSDYTYHRHYVAHFRPSNNEITVTANPVEGGTVSGGGVYGFGAECTLTAMADQGYLFVDWTENGKHISYDTSYSFIVTEARNLVANFREGYGCAVVFDFYDEYGDGWNGNKLVVTDDYGYSYQLTLAEGFSGTQILMLVDGSHITLTWIKDFWSFECSFTVSYSNGAVICEASELNNSFNFEFDMDCVDMPVVTFDITAIANPVEGGIVSGGGEYDYRSECMLTATPNEGYLFANWTENGNIVSYDANYSFIVTRNRNLVANFVEGDVCAITFDFYDTYGDGWNGDKLVVTDDNGISYELTLEDGFSGTQVLMLVDGSHITLTWIEQGLSYESSFIVRYSNGNVICQGSELNSSFLYEFYVDCVEMPVSTFDITAIADPVEGGTVDGGGEYDYGAECTLTATANGGYTFVNWTKNGQTVSSSATYTFTVTKAATYVAHFSINSYESTATTNPNGVGTIAGNGSYNYGQTCTLTATPAEGYSFVNWTKSNIEVSTEATYSFIVTESATYVANFVPDQNEVTQETSLAQGWNWWSTYVEQEGVNGLGMLEENLGDNGVTIRSQVGYTDYYAGYGWYGSLSSINNESSYKIKANTSCSVSMIGVAAVPSQHPITLSHGWTWMGYAPSVAMDVQEALSGLEATVGDKLKSQQGYADFYQSYGWYGSLNTIEPGMGLMYYSSNGETVTFTYPDNSRGGVLKANLTSENNHWVPNVHTYPDNMTVMAVVELNDKELNTENYELAAFTANGECRGSVKLTYAEPLHRHVAFLTISGKDAIELSFRLYNAETNEEYNNAKESLDFVTNAIVGEATDLYKIHFRGTTDMDELSCRVQIYPNPVNRGECISIGVVGDETEAVQVEIINMLGVVETVCTPSRQTFTAPDVAGVYTLRIIVEGKGIIIRKLVVK